MLKKKKIDSYIKQVEHSINEASKVKSKIIDKVVHMPGFSSPRIRCLLNNLCDMKKVNYLELGSYRGATLISALWSNDVTAYAVDNFMFDSKRYEVKQLTVEKVFKENISVYMPDADISFIESDIDKVDTDDIVHPINVVFYDCGMETPEESENNLTHMLTTFDEVFILVVGRYSDRRIQKGVTNFISNNKITNHYMHNLLTPSMQEDQGWWAGIGLFVLERDVNEKVRN